MLASFVRANRKLSFALTPKHIKETNVFSMYRKCAQMLMAQPGVRTVADIGTGRYWQFPAHMKEAYHIRLIGLDIARDEIARNTCLDEAVVCDVTVAIPVTPSSFDLVMCNSGVEHFQDNRSVLDNVYAALRPGGYFIAQFPGSWAPHALINQWLPGSVSGLLLKYLTPGSEGECGFEAHYDQTRYSKYLHLAQKAGFVVDYHFPGYFGADYFAFFTPAYLLHRLYDHVRFAIGLRDLASYNLFVLRKPGGSEPPIYWSTEFRADDVTAERTAYSEPASLQSTKQRWSG